MSGAGGRGAMVLLGLVVHIGIGELEAPVINIVS